MDIVYDIILLICISLLIALGSIVLGGIVRLLFYIWYNKSVKEGVKTFIHDIKSEIITTE